MYRESEQRYPWPASAISESDMGLLYRAREESAKRVPITRLLANAVRETYGEFAQSVDDTNHTIERKEAA